MDCKSPLQRIACAIRDASEPELFDWLSLVWVPTLLALVTLAVAIASWRVARAGHDLSKRLAESSADQQARQQRLDLVGQLLEWSSWRWTGEDTPLSQKSRKEAEIHRISLLLTSSDLPGADQLQHLLWEMDRTELPDDLSRVVRSIALSYLHGAMAYKSQRAIVEWSLRPDKFEETADVFVEDIPDTVRSAVKRGQEAAKELEEGATPEKKSAKTRGRTKN